MSDIALQQKPAFFGSGASGWAYDSTFYVTSENLLDRGLQRLEMLMEVFEHIGARNLHQRQKAWELQHRILTAESMARHTPFRQETRWPGSHYRADHPKLDDVKSHCFTRSQYEPKTAARTMSKRPVHHRRGLRAVANVTDGRGRSCPALAPRYDGSGAPCQSIS